MKCQQERGSILLLAVLLSSLLIALSVTLLATASIEVHGTERMHEMQKLEALAHSGVEIAAARWRDGRLSSVVEELRLDDQELLTIDWDESRDPALEVVARIGGAKRRVQANLIMRNGLEGYALAVFGTENRFSAPAHIWGSAYFAAPAMTFAFAPLLDLSSHLDVAAGTLDAQQLLFSGNGRLRTARHSAERPTVDLRALRQELAERGLPPHIVRGDVPIRGLRWSGVLWIEVEAGETCVVEDLELDGTLVVEALDLDPLLAPNETQFARISMRGTTQIRANASLLGRLALAAPHVQWDLGAEGTTRIQGLAVVGDATNLHELDVQGSLWVRGSMHALHDVAVQSPATWPSDPPAAVQAPASLNRVQIDWR